MWRCPGHSPLHRHKGMKGDHLVGDKGFFYSMHVWVFGERGGNLHTCVTTGLCVFPCVANTPDRRERGRLGGPPGTNFPSLLRKACSLLRAGGNNTPQCAKLHLLPFSLILSHSSWNTTVRHTDFPQCTAARLRSRDWLRWALQGFKAVAAAWNVFSLPPFFICHVLRAKINQTSWFLVFPGCCMWAPTVSSWHWRGGRASETKDKSRDTACIWRMLIH